MKSITLELCVVNEDNIEMIRNWRNTPEVSEYMYTNNHISKDQQIQWFSRVNRDPTKKYWIIKFGDKFVGMLNLYNIDMRNKRCHWAYYLADPSVRGKGLGRLIELNILSYVFEKLNLNKLCCEVLSFNDIVIKIHQKYGSNIEGTFRQHILKDGKFHDIVCMGILKDVWKEIKEKFNFEIIKIA